MCVCVCIIIQVQIHQKRCLNSLYVSIRFLPLYICCVCVFMFLEASGPLTAPFPSPPAPFRISHHDNCMQAIHQIEFNTERKNIETNFMLYCCIIYVAHNNKCTVGRAWYLCCCCFSFSFFLASASTLLLCCAGGCCVFYVYISVVRCHIPYYILQKSHTALQSNNIQSHTRRHTHTAPYYTLQ